MHSVAYQRQSFRLSRSDNPSGTAFLAAPLLEEILTLLQFVGGATALVGIYIVNQAHNRSSEFPANHKTTCNQGQDLRSEKIRDKNGAVQKWTAPKFYLFASECSSASEAVVCYNEDIPHSVRDEQTTHYYAHRGKYISSF